jgi:hypothetical protein
MRFELNLNVVDVLLKVPTINFFLIKPTKCTNFTTLFLHETLRVSSRTRNWSCSKAFYKPVWHIPLLGVQWINSWWWTEELSETFRVSCQNTVVKLVHLVGFIKKKFVTMHGQMNVKFPTINLHERYVQWGASRFMRRAYLLKTPPTVLRRRSADRSTFRAPVAIFWRTLTCTSLVGLPFLLRRRNYFYLGGESVISVTRYHQTRSSDAFVYITVWWFIDVIFNFRVNSRGLCDRRSPHPGQSYWMWSGATITFYSYNV